jgi:glycosyltransferase involved in cell wall biosynthesis
MDLLATVPYYTGHLCDALSRVDELQVAVGSITYHLDRDFFRDRGIQNRPGAFDWVSKVPIPSPALRRLLKVTEYLINMLALLVRFILVKPDVLHVQFLPLVKTGLPFEIWFLKLVKRRGIKIVYTVHNVLPHNTGDRHRARSQQIFNLANRLICHDACARDRLVNEFQIRPEQISIVPHGPLFAESSTRTPRQARKDLGIPADQCLVLWQGILRPYKGVPFLLEAWQHVARFQNGGACLAIVGTGDEQLVKAIQRDVSALNIGRSVRLELRFVSLSELADFYLAADVLVYPYSEVTTSGALMTGLGYGKAIVASKLPAFEELLRHQGNAMIVSYGDVEGLAKTLARLIGDPGLRRRLGECARESHMNGPQWPEIAKDTLECYESALTRGPQ